MVNGKSEWVAVETGTALSRIAPWGGTVQGNKFRPSFLFNFVVANERKDDVCKTVP